MKDIWHHANSSFYYYAAGLDYDYAQLNISLSDTKKRHPFSINVIDDSILEGNETFSVVVTALHKDARANIQLAVSEVNMTICDDNDCELELAM